MEHVLTGSTEPETDEFTEFGEWAQTIYTHKYAWRDEEGQPIEVWPDTAYRVVRHVLGALNYSDRDYEFQALVKAIVDRKFIPAGRYLANAGRPYHQVNNCFLARCGDSISDTDGWAEVVSNAIKALSSGGGVGVVYSDVRPYGAPISRTGGYGSGPLSPAKMVNEVAREVIAGGGRRAALWGGLHWDHQDIFDWIKAKDWSEDIRAAKAKDFNFAAPLDMTNISVILNSEFFFAFHNENHPRHDHAQKVYWESLTQMLKHGEPGFSIDVGDKVNESLRNPCTEVCSEDSNDVCCLGSINLSRIDSIEEFDEIVRLGTLFLIAGTVYSDVPYEKVKVTRAKNRRIGLGLMGLHEWLIQRGSGYEVSPELHEWLAVYRDTSDEAAKHWAAKHNLSEPVAKRAIAPTGSIGILAETTTGVEPIFVSAYKRRFLDNGVWKYQYVLDPTATRMKEQYGVDPDQIETAMTLANDPRKRIKFQAEVQDYVDMAISSTINLPHPITDPDWIEHYGNIFMEFLPRLRGLTCYPSGARAGQPMEPALYKDVVGLTGVTMIDDRDEQCLSGVCGL